MATRKADAFTAFATSSSPLTPPQMLRWIISYPFGSDFSRARLLSDSSCPSNQYKESLMLTKNGSPPQQLLRTTGSLARDPAAQANFWPGVTTVRENGGQTRWNQQSYWG